MSRRQVERLVPRYEDEGPSGLVSRKRGRPSNHQLPPGLTERAMALIRERSADFGPTLIPEVARKVRRELKREMEAAEVASEATAIARFRAQAKSASIAAPMAAQPRGDFFDASLVCTGWEALGYRDTAMIFDLRPAKGEWPLRVEMRLSARDGDRVGEHLRRIHRDAWERAGRSPLDVQPGEVRPSWID